VNSGSADGLRDFLSRREVTAVIVQQTNPGAWPSVLAAIGLKPLKTGGVLFYRVPAA
jgi:hypothetical protein